MGDIYKASHVFVVREKDVIMIGTHNSLTCYSASKRWMRLFSFMWRCQKLTISRQFEKGATFFDIRVRFNDDGDYCFCHGLVDIVSWWDITTLLDFIKKNGGFCRIVVERGSPIGIFDIIPSEYLSDGTVIQVIVKKGWKVLYSNTDNIEMVDHTYVPVNTGKGFWWNVRHFKPSTIKRWARKHNPKFDEDTIKDDKIHFVDYLE